MKKILFIILMLFISMPIFSTYIKVGLYAGAYPVSFVNDEGRPAGLYYDILNHILTNEGYKSIFIIYDKFSDMYRDGKNGKLDIICNLIKTPEREKDFYFSEVSINSAWSEIFTTKNSNVETIKDLIGERVGLMHDDQNGKYFIDMMKKFNFEFFPVYYDSFNEAIKAMKFGYIKAIAAYNLLPTEYNGIIGTSIIFNPSSISLATAINPPSEILKLFSIIDKHLNNEKNNSDSVYYDILNKWLHIKVIKTETIPAIIYWVISIIFIIIIITLGIIILMRIIIKNKTKALIKSEQSFKDAQHIAKVGNWIYSLKDKIFHVSDEIKNIYGLADDDVLNINMLQSLIHPDDKIRILNNFNNSIMNGIPANHIYKIIVDNKIKYVRSDALYTKTNGYPELFGTVQDITELRKKELELKELNNDLELRVEEQIQMLLQQETLASIGRMVAGMAHEINTPIGVALTASTFLYDKANATIKLYNNENLSEEEFNEFFTSLTSSFSMINQNLVRAADLIKALKDISVDQTVEDKRTINIKEYIGSIMYSLHPRFRTTKHTYKLNILDVEIETFPSALAQILTNFITNSIDHGFEGIEKGLININFDKINDKYCLIYKDNGIGIEDISKIYEPFYTTKRGRGFTGLGLNIVYTLVHEKFDGTIECKSEKNKGVKFTIKFK